MNKKDKISSVMETMGGWFTIEYIKVDGTPSEMIATLDPKLIPHFNLAYRHTSTPQTLSVYAKKSSGRTVLDWRSFRVDNATGLYATL